MDSPDPIFIRPSGVERPPEVRDRLRRFIRDSFFVEAFSDHDSFLATGMIDSLGLMELVAFVQSEFSVTVAERDLVPDNFGSIDSICAYVARKLQA